MTDTDPDMPAQRRPRPVLSISLTWRQIAVLVGAVGTPSGYLFQRNRTVEQKATVVQAKQSAVDADVDTAQAQLRSSFEALRRDQLTDRTEIGKLGEADKDILDEMRIIKAALAAQLPKSSRRKLTARPDPTPAAPAPRPPLPATPEAAAATVPVPEPPAPNPAQTGPPKEKTP